MSSPRPRSPSDFPPPSSSPSLPVPQIPPRLSSSPSPSPLYGSPRRSPAFLENGASPGASPGVRASSSSSNLSRSRAASSSAHSPLPPNAVDSGTATPTPDGQAPLTDAQKAEVVRRHLLSAGEQHRLASDQALQSGFSLPQSHSAAAGGSFPQLGSGAAGEGGAPAAVTGLEEEYPTPYHLEGGDVVAGVYKWAAQAAAGTSPSAGGAGGLAAALAGAGAAAGVGGGPAALRRSKSMDTVAAGDGLASRRTSHAQGAAGERAAFRAGLEAEHEAGEEPPQAEGFSREEMLQPGGFRRDFVFRRMAERGETPIPASDASSEVNASGVSLSGSSGMATPGRGRYPTRSFIDFLSLYGHFGGEDLEEIEEEDEEDEEEAVEGIEQRLGFAPTERTPLVRDQSTASRFGRGHSRKRTSAADKQQGDATVTQAVMMLLKSFVGTGVLFLGKAFFNGGILFSAIVLCAIAMISLYSFLLLVETRLVINGSFGDIGGVLYGKYMRWAVLSAIVISQIGFVSAYIIFVAENLQAFFKAVTHCRHIIDISWLIMAQLVIFLPLAMIRNIQKLSGTALVADVFIILGLVYIFSSEIALLADRGIAKVALFNPNNFPLLIGTAVFAFEGIGLIIPVQEAMKEPHKLPKVLTGVMVGVMVLFAGAGTLAYLTYGDDIQTVVFVNLPQDDKFVNASQFLYSLAILLSTPLQLFPAVRIMENGLFGSQKSGKHNPKVKWEKNAFRALTVVGCALVSWVGANDLDKFVSLIGSVACVPLGMIFPPMLYYKACARTWRQKANAVVLMIFGVLCALYTGYQTISLLVHPPTKDASFDTLAACAPHR
ncbi:hypothetical protein JCM8547_007690 [Rhodosporidiobolus lusitaniae]